MNSIFNRWYCIVDTRGKFYTVNKHGDLVQVESKNEARWFGILEANQIISDSGMEKSFRVVVANSGGCQKKDELIVSENRECGESETITMEDVDFVRLVKELIFIQGNLEKYQNELRRKQSAVDEEICDILHFIELFQRDEEKSLELVDRIQDCRKRRRKVKDAMVRAESFGRIFTAGGMETILKDIKKQFDKMEVREYAPRRLPGLFAGGKKLAELPEEGEWEEYEDDGWEEEMVYERKGTIFDGKKNDWEAFVTQQTEIFGSMEQHAANLQLDMEELDKQIEEQLVFCEKTECNAAQGYKMFKMLKELRLARKEKEEEFKKVEAIIECFDCDGMVSTYRECADMLGVGGKVKMVVENEDDAREEETESALWQRNRKDFLTES